jgi:hypothetical protein
MKNIKSIRVRGRRGYTLTEVLLASSVSVTIVALTVGLYLGIFKSWRGMDQRMQADREVNIALSRMVYGMGERRGIRSASTVNLVTNTPSGGWTLTYAVPIDVPQTNSIVYSKTTSSLVFSPGSLILGTNITLAAVSLQANSLILTLRVDRVEGPLKARREVSSRIAWRN